MRDSCAPTSDLELACGYPVLIRPGLTEMLGEKLALVARDRRIIIVSDESVWAAQGARLRAGLEASGLEAIPLILRPGEGTKSWTSLIQLTDRLLELGVERGDTLVAFGGGVIGDLAGFASAILKRGCRYVQVPTSLLAQVDSSVGGKTGINVAAGKNLIGAFHRPAAVFVDPTLLSTLHWRHLQAGYAETVKYALIGDPDFFRWCEEFGELVIAGDLEARLHAIRKCIQAKAEIVAADECETEGRRMLLNFGHSFAHSLEAETGFGETLLHGEAVALGMTLAFRLSAERGYCGDDECARVAVHLKRMSLPTDVRHLALGATGAGLVARMRHDKKAQGGKLPLILTRGIGRAFVDNNVGDEELAAFLDRQLDTAGL